jgi:hypothetical protein
MKSKVLDRPMFKKGMMAVEAGPMEEIDPENVGIMSGFKDMLVGLELPEDSDEGDTAEMMGRTPDSPEILMNNLRGDMRSVDARKEELADLVGMRAASETPDSVLALLQPVLAGQAMPAMGAPAGAPGLPPPPPPGMMPPAPPEGMAGMMPPPDGMPMPPMPPAPPMPGGGIGSLPAAQGPEPVQMRNGGIVQRFKDGTLGPDEDQDGGVSPVYSASAVGLPSETSRTEIYNFLARQPMKVPTLEDQVKVREPVYQKLLGSDKSLSQAQMLFDIAQAGLNLSAGVDAEGRPLRGAQSPVSRFAAAFSKVPAQIGARAGEASKEDRAIKLAAIQAAEKDIENTRKYNADIIESLRKSEEKRGASIFGKGDWHWNVVNTPGLLERSLRGETSPAEENVIASAITEFRSQARPAIETQINPNTQKPYTVERPGKFIPQFVLEFDKARGAATRGAPAAEPVSTAPTTPGAAPATAAPAAAPTIAAPAAATTAPAPSTQPLGSGIRPMFPDRTVQPTQPSPSMGPTSLLEAANYGTGLFEVPVASLYSIPGIGNVVASAFPQAGQMTDARNYINNTKGAISLALRETTRFNEGERKDIESRLDIDPSMLTRTSGLISKLVSLDRYLGEKEAVERTKAADPNLSAENQRNAELRASDIQGVRTLVGVRNVPIITNMDQFRNHIVGPYLLLNRGEYSYGVKQGKQ